jgi:hypothetical protein
MFGPGRSLAACALSQISLIRSIKAQKNSRTDANWVSNGKKQEKEAKLHSSPYDLSILFLFSLRLRRSTRFACILAAKSS